MLYNIIMNCNTYDSIWILVSDKYVLYVLILTIIFSVPL